MRPRTFLTSQKATSQNYSQKFPISLPVHQLVIQTDVYPLEGALVGVRVAILPQQLSGSGALSSASMQQFRPHVLCSLSQRGALPPGVGCHPLRGLSPWWALHLLVPRGLLSVWGAGPEAQNVRMPKPQGERACTTL